MFTFSIDDCRWYSIQQLKNTSFIKDESRISAYVWLWCCFDSYSHVHCIVWFGLLLCVNPLLADTLTLMIMQNSSNQRVYSYIYTNDGYVSGNTWFFYYYIALTKPYIGFKYIISRRTQAENSKYKCAIARACLNVKLHVIIYSFYFGLHCSYIISFLQCVVNGWDSYFELQHNTFL